MASISSTSSGLFLLLLRWVLVPTSWTSFSSCSAAPLPRTHPLPLPPCFELITVLSPSAILRAPLASALRHSQPLRLYLRKPPHQSFLSFPAHDSPYQVFCPVPVPFNSLFLFITSSCCPGSCCLCHLVKSGHTPHPRRLSPSCFSLVDWLCHIPRQIQRPVAAGQLQAHLLCCKT
jgi:hypothetical protein